MNLNEIEPHLHEKFCRKAQVHNIIRYIECWRAIFQLKICKPLRQPHLLAHGRVETVMKTQRACPSCFHCYVNAREINLIQLTPIYELLTSNCSFTRHRISAWPARLFIPRWPYDFTAANQRRCWPLAPVDISAVRLLGNKTRFRQIIKATAALIGSSTPKLRKIRLFSLHRESRQRYCLRFAAAAGVCKCNERLPTGILVLVNMQCKHEPRRSDELVSARATASDCMTLCIGEYKRRIW